MSKTILPQSPASERFPLKKAAPYIGAADQTLYQWRNQGIGPKSYKLGNRVYYDKVDLDAWCAAQKIRTARGGAA